jgi:ArsR family transcriptional regulator
MSKKLEIRLHGRFTQLMFSIMEIERTAARLEAIGNPTRLALYRWLVRAGRNGLAVGDIQQRLQVPRSTLSHHLHRLIGVGLVTQERQATTLICRANYPAMDELIGFLTAECCADADSCHRDNAA